MFDVIIGIVILAAGIVLVYFMYKKGYFADALNIPKEGIPVPVPTSPTPTPSTPTPTPTPTPVPKTTPPKPTTPAPKTKAPQIENGPTPNIPKPTSTIVGDMVYPTKGSTWFSTAWNNGKKRTLKSNQVDPSDSKFAVRRAGNPTAVIDGKGICVVSGESPRIECRMSHKNAELTIFVNWTNMRSITLHVRSYEIGGQESAYGCHFDGNGDAWIKKESGNTYSPRIASKSNVALPPNAWTGVKQVVKDVSGGVLVESYIKLGNAAWVKVCSAVDDGKWGNGAPLTGTGTQAYARINDGTNTLCRNMSLRQI